MRLALDIGATTVTCRGRVDPSAAATGTRGRAFTVFFDGEPSMPAAICFQGSGAVTGREALAVGAGDPTSFVGSPLTAVLEGRLHHGGADRHPAELLMPVLATAVAHARDVDPEPPESITCVVPLGATSRLREPLAQAARSLGLPDPTLVPEPVAAVLHATGGRGLSPGATGVVIDVGGSSVEVTVLRGLPSGMPSVLANHVDRTLGGDDVDKRILAWLGHRLEMDDPPLASALRAETNRTLLANLRVAVRRAKEELAFAPETDIAVTTLRGHGVVAFTRGDLDRILVDWTRRLTALVVRALGEAGLPADGSTGCFVIGGGASLPTLQRALAPVGRTTIAHEPLTAAADGALMANLSMIDGLAEMDESVVPVDVSAAPAAAPKRPSFRPSSGASSGPTSRTRPDATIPANPFRRQSPFLDAPAGSVAVGARFRRVWAGPSQVLAEDADGRTWQWGQMPMTRLLAPLMTPHPVPGLRDGVVGAGAGDSFAVALHGDGRVSSWGYDDHGQLGQPGITPPAGTVAQPSLPAALTSVSVGHSHVLGVTDLGRVVSWGNHGGGRLGTGAAQFGDVRPPALVGGAGGGPSDVVAVAAGANHSLALDDGGGLWGWGRD
ncbi:Hsp70 family protein, partial [uncultured Corynebacterium sp.]|uniref:Hsp70 family protein n=1 Tax=uncultured Corynebacterium sp. TaxID=159447 RepID=UPI0025F80439